MNEILDNIKNQIKTIEEQKQTLINELSSKFPTLFTPLFEQAPKLNCFSWRQYTPYFNDGDECVFRVNIDDLIINGLDLDESIAALYLYKTLQNEEDVCINNEISQKLNYTWYKKRLIGQTGISYNPDYDEQTAIVVTQIKDVLREISDEFYKELFGDHCTVTVFSDGNIEIEEYDHD